MVIRIMCTLSLLIVFATPVPFPHEIKLEGDWYYNDGSCSGIITFHKGGKWYSWLENKDSYNEYEGTWSQYEGVLDFNTYWNSNYLGSDKFILKVFNSKKIEAVSSYRILTFTRKK
jgi:hypothetical protein